MISSSTPASSDPHPSVTGSTARCGSRGELSYRDNTIAGVTIQTEGPQILNGGSIRAFGIMANGWIDIPTGTRVTPYFGGGAGGAHINLAVDTSLGGGAGCTPCTHIDYDG